jgi:hypothetical protein
MKKQGGIKGFAYDISSKADQMSEGSTNRAARRAAAAVKRKGVK